MRKKGKFILGIGVLISLLLGGCSQPSSSILSQPTFQSDLRLLEELELYQNHEKALKPYFEQYHKQRTPFKNQAQLEQLEMTSVLKARNHLVYGIEVYVKEPLQNGDWQKKKYGYEVKVKPEPTLKVEKIEKASPLMPDSEVQVPYWDTPSELEKQRIAQYMEAFFKASPQFYEDYEKSWIKGFGDWKNKINTLCQVADVVQTTEQTYQDAFDASLTPYRFSEERLTPLLDSLKIEVSPKTTLKNHWFQVEIHAEVLSDEENKVYYTYHYTIGLNQDKIIYLQLERMMT